MAHLQYLILIVGLGLLPFGAAAQTPVTPAKGSAERKALLDVLRPMVEKELGIEVIFEVRTLQVLNGWAFGDLVPRQKNGQSIDYTKTKIDPAFLDAFDDWICVLWRKGPKGWKIELYNLGATDLPYGCWWKEFKAPKAIFPFSESDQNCQPE